MASGATDNVPVLDPEPIEPVAILLEALGSAVLCGGIFAVALLLGNTTVRGNPVTVVIRTIAGVRFVGLPTVVLGNAFPGAEVASAADRSS